MNIYTQLAQVRVLFQKNVLTLKKGRMSIILNCLLIPFFAGWATKWLDYNPYAELHPPIQAIKGVERCSKDPRSAARCMNFAFSPDKTSIRSIAKAMSDANQTLEDGDELHISPGNAVTALEEINNESQVYAFKDRKTTVDFFNKNNGKLSPHFYVHFENYKLDSLQFEVFIFNREFSNTYMTLLYHALLSTKPHDSTKIMVKKFPDVETVDIFWRFFLWILQLGVLFMVSTQITGTLFSRMMADRANDMLNYMRMFGMSVSAYHFAWFLSELLIVQTLSGCCLAVGLWLGNSDLFKAIDPKVLILIWYLVGASNIGLSLVISTIVPSLAFGNVLINISSFIVGVDFFLKILETMLPNVLPRALVGFFAVLAFIFPARFLLSLLFCILLKIFGSFPNIIVCQYFVVRRVTFSNLFHYMPEEATIPKVFALVQLVTTLMSLFREQTQQLSRSSNSEIGGKIALPVSFSPGADLFVWLIYIFTFPLIAAYLRDVLPWNEGRRKPFYFFLMPSFWLGSDVKKAQSLESLQMSSLDDHDSKLDEDVKQELINARNPPDATFAMSDLQKTYYFFSSPTISKIFGFPGHTALRNFSLVMKQGECVALLGHNGAGKSTMLGIVTGRIDADGGRLIVNRKVIDPDYIHEYLGFCPQFDMLFEGLTVEQHLWFYLGLRGENLHKHWDSIKGRIDSFRMTGAMARNSENLSGGMKRRLSVLIATLGDPEIVLMDEPTTGMDPVNRRFVWRFLSDYKAKRQLLLSSHSMEEAETIGDRIIIVRSGDVVAVGTSSHLKHKYDIGYRMTLHTQQGFEEMAFQTVKAKLPLAQLDTVHAAVLRVCVPAANLSEMIDFLEKTTETETIDGEKPLFVDWTFSQMTLEDVFYRLNAAVYEAKGQKDVFAGLRAPPVPVTPTPLVNATFPPQGFPSPSGPPPQYYHPPGSPGSPSYYPPPPPPGVFGQPPPQPGGGQFPPQQQQQQYGGYPPYPPQGGQPPYGGQQYGQYPPPQQGYYPPPQQGQYPPPSGTPPPPGYMPPHSPHSPQSPQSPYPQQGYYPPPAPPGTPPPPGYTPSPSPHSPQSQQSPHPPNNQSPNRQ
jgi:ABC-type multidrug transport system ATPase subunit